MAKKTLCFSFKSAHFTWCHAFLFSPYLPKNHMYAWWQWTPPPLKSGQAWQHFLGKLKLAWQEPYRSEKSNKCRDIIFYSKAFLKMPPKAKNHTPPLLELGTIWRRNRMETFPPSCLQFRLSAVANNVSDGCGAPTKCDELINGRGLVPRQRFGRRALLFVPEEVPY